MDRMCSGNFYTRKQFTYLRTKRKDSTKINLIIKNIKM